MRGRPVRGRRIAARTTLFALLVLALLVVLGLGYRDVNQGTLDRALFKAVQTSNTERVQSLLNEGADPNVLVDPFVTAPVSPGDWAAFFRQRLLSSWNERFRVGNRSDSRRTPLGVATAHNDVFLVRRLLEHGANVDQAEPFQSHGPPLVIASVGFGGNNAMIRALLDHGARVNAANQNGKTALSHVIMFGNVPGLRLLLERGADPNVADASGRTPLMRAASDLVFGVNLARYTEIASLLVRHGADVNRRDARGKTALALAADHQRPAIVALLKRRGATR